MISVKLAKELNELVSKVSGGSAGIRDHELLLSALNRPFQTYNSLELYPSAIEKGAAIFQSIILNHPFHDGNKRAAYLFMRIFLTEDGFDLEASEDEKYEFVISAAKGELEFEVMKKWVLNHIKTSTNE
jgi:death-on-curing protein